MDDTKLIERAKRGDRAAFDMLYARHERRVRGFIRARAAKDTNTQEEIAHLTWLTAWQKLPTYEPHRSSFPTFVKYWASLVLLRYYEAQGLQRKVEVLFSEFITRFPGLAEEESVVPFLQLPALVERPLEEILLLAEDEGILTTAYEDLLRLAFSDSSPPHQLIAFGFAKLLAWPPRKIVAELSDVRLKALAARLEREYVHTAQLPQDRVRPYFRQLQEVLNRPFRYAAKDPRTRNLYAHLLQRIVGETTLQEYYVGQTNEQRAADITKWWDAVIGLTQGPLFSLLQEKIPRQLARKSPRAGLS
jgi:DNA-directed RNA polymerase specialized sigma24 family protein